MAIINVSTQKSPIAANAPKNIMRLTGVFSTTRPCRASSPLKVVRSRPDSFIESPASAFAGFVTKTGEAARGSGSVPEHIAVAAVRC
jgi:hypothetical protein